MKTFFVLGLFLFLSVGLNAQSFKCIKSGNSVTVKKVNSDSLLRPYEDKGGLTRYEVKNPVRQKKWSVQLKNDALPESINEKIKIVPGYVSATLYFNEQGGIIDITLYVSNIIYENLTETEICSIYDRLMKVKMDMDNFIWNGDFNFSSYSIFLKRSKPVQ